MNNPALKSLYRALVAPSAARLATGNDSAPAVPPAAAAAPRELDREALRAVSGGAASLDLPKRGW